MVMLLNHQKRYFLLLDLPPAFKRDKRQIDIKDHVQAHWPRWRKSLLVPSYSDSERSRSQSAIECRSENDGPQKLGSLGEYLSATQEL